MFLEYAALFLLVFVAIVLFYSVIAIHDIPYEIAERRNHPHRDAIHVAGWVSLFTLHVLWPFLWIWATLWREDQGWGFVKLEDEQKDIQHRLQVLSDRIDKLEQEQQPTPAEAVQNPDSVEPGLADSEKKEET